jgi:hypothetical protein
MLEASPHIGRVASTSLTIKPYRGKAGTTAKDVINYYVMECLARVPTFISNAEVLGLNIADSTAGEYPCARHRVMCAPF